MSAEEGLQAPVSKEPVQDEFDNVSPGTELSGLRLAAVFTVLCLAVFLVALVSKIGSCAELHQYMSG